MLTELSNFFTSFTAEGSNNLLFLIVGLFVLFFLWLLSLTFFLLREVRWLRRILGDTAASSLREILREHLERVGIVQIKLNDLESLVQNLLKAEKTHIQKIGLVRFNPFKDTGGDQSFVIALLDGKKNGLVISSLHSRERTRIYAKPVKGGQGTVYPLSQEEEEAIQAAQEFNLNHQSSPRGKEKQYKRI